MKLSIITATYTYDERNQKISRLLDVLLPQFAQRNDTELIIVSNGKSALNCDNLANHIKQENFLFLKEKIGQLEVKIIHDPIAGLSRARNTGIALARGEILAFIDDDTVPCENYISNLISAYNATNAFCIGGAVYLLDTEIDYPNWYSDYFKRFIAPPVFPDHRTLVKSPFYIIGANMSFRSEVFKKYGVFDLDLARVGKKLLSGEDIEMVLRLPEERVYIDPEVFVFTDVNVERLRFSFYIPRLFWQGVSDAIISRKLPKMELYDFPEIKISKGALSFIFTKLIQGKPREFLCAMSRFAGYQLTCLRSK